MPSLVSSRTGNLYRNQAPRQGLLPYSAAMFTPATLISDLKQAWLRDHTKWSIPPITSEAAAEALVQALRNENLDLLFLQLAMAAHPAIALPPTLQHMLTTSYKVEKGAQLLMDAEIGRLTKALAHLPCLFLKGRALTAQLGLDLYKRSGDIDMLFHKKDLGEVIPCLQGLGYRVIFSTANGEFSMQNAVGLIVDVHYNLIASSTFICLSQLRVQDWFRDTRLAAIGRHQVPTLSLNLTFTHLCLHFAVNHRFNDFTLLFELRLFLQRYGAYLDRAWISAYAYKHNFQVLLYLTLRLLMSYCPAPAEQAWLGELGSPAGLLDRVEQFLTSHQLDAAILGGQDNGVAVNDVPKLCADTLYKRILYQQGIQYWNFKLFDRSFRKAFG